MDLLVNIDVDDLDRAEAFYTSVQFLGRGYDEIAGAGAAALRD